MRVYIQLKQIRKRMKPIEAVPYELAGNPRTLRELLTALVRREVELYQERISGTIPAVRSEEEIRDMSLVGKIGFGLSFGNRIPDPEEAVETALQGFEDGLYRLFVGDREMESLDAVLDLREEDTITIIRLVMLTGGYF